ncbi:DNA primase small subunit [Cryptosporidium bovis]|uniref:DNA primase small subunit n=1 Tax=Cryptosporidium bovis TaxID=310047 RepID=UPI00351A80CF|nr:DNA primase small subunit [Cryptosporidium bovis]
MPNREFSMTLKSDVSEDEIYLRWQSFKGIEQLKQELINKTPHKFDIGAIYNIPISEKEISPIGFKQVQRELVFDIDMNDYDDIRTCCKDKTVCERCWLYIIVAIRLIDTSLREDFGFSHILWIYSGRRGVHCWVCDTKARLLPSEARSAIVDYLTLITGNENRKKKVNLKTNNPNKSVHPFIDRSYKICMEYFERIIERQRLFDSSNKEQIDKVLSHLSDDHNVHDILSNWIKQTRDFTSIEFWDFVSNMLNENNHLITLKEIVFTFSYPRLDINVSKDLGHLLKAPFCIHHSTGRLCIPIDILNISNFNPKQVPTLTKIRKEYDNTENVNNVNNKYVPSIIKEYVNYMENFVDNLLIEVKKEQCEYDTILQLAK